MNKHAYARRVGSGECRGHCAGGHPCALSDKMHSHHVCADARCACHDAASYGLVRSDAGGAAHYNRLTVLAVRR